MWKITHVVYIYMKITKCVHMLVIGYWLSVIGYRLLVYKYGVRFVALFRNRHKQTHFLQKACMFVVFLYKYGASSPKIMETLTNKYALFYITYVFL